MAQWVVSLPRDPKIENSRPIPCTHVVFLGNSLKGPLPCMNVNQQIAWGQPDEMLGGNLRWISIPSRGSRNRDILQKRLSDGPSGSPSFDLGQTLPLPSPENKACKRFRDFFFGFYNYRCINAISVPHLRVGDLSIDPPPNLFHAVSLKKTTVAVWVIVRIAKKKIFRYESSVCLGGIMWL